jgi:hypothetical protein
VRFIHCGTELISFKRHLNFDKERNKEERREGKESHSNKQ